MRWLRVIQFKNEAITIEFTPLVGNRDYSHVVTILRQDTPIAMDFLRKGQEINEKITEQFYRKHVKEEKENEMG